MNRLGKIWTWLKWPLALGIIGLLYSLNREQLQKIAETPKDWRYLALAVVLMGGSTLLTFFRWYLLVAGLQFPFRFRDALRLGFLGLLSNYVMPGALGGDLIKAVLLARDHPTRKTVAIATILLDRILGVLALFMVGAVATLTSIDVPPSRELQLCTLLLWVGSIGGLVGVGVMLLPGLTTWRWVQRLTHLPVVGRLLAELIEGVKLYQSRPVVLAQALGLSVIGHSGLICGFYCCALWMQQPWIPDLATHFYFMPNAELFGVLMPLPGGVGPLEAAIQWFYALLKPQSVPLAQAHAAGLAAALAFRVVTMGIAAIGGAYYFAARREIAAAMHEAEEESKPEEGEPTATAPIAR